MHICRTIITFHSSLFKHKIENMWILFECIINHNQYLVPTYYGKPQRNHVVVVYGLLSTAINELQGWI